MRKVAFLALAIVAVGCSVEPQPASIEATVPAVGDPGVTPAQVRAFEKLQLESGRAWTWTQHEDFATPSHLSAARTGKPLLAHGKSPAQTTVELINDYRELFKMKDAAAELSVSKSDVDELAHTHVRFQQVMRGIPVAGAELAAHYDDKGRLTSIDANYVSGINDIDLEPKISAKLGRDIALADVVASTKNVDESQLHSTDGKLVIFARGNQAGRAALAFEYTVRAVYGDEPAIWVTKVDAKTGEILDRYDNLQTIEATGSGVLGDSKKFQVAQSGATFTMTDTSRGVSIQTFSAGGQQVGPGQGAKAVTSTTLTSWDTGVGAGAAVDAHAYAGVVFDYYKKVHARNAIDGAGGAMLSTAHFGQAYDNAFWDGTGMSYGDGGTAFRPLSAGLDVVAHEFTHGVTELTSALVYQGQPGALNESVSDIFGVFIEHSLKPDDAKNWLMGENIAKGTAGLRDFKNPAKGQQPSNMKSYVNTQQDNGGVHINSGIPNNAAFLMTMGGTNPGSAIAVKFGIGWEKSEKLWYRANTKYFLSTTNFAQAAQAVMQAAKDIALTDNETNIVDCAWKAVGVVQGTCSTIVDPKAAPVPPAPGTDPGTGTDPGGNTTGSTGSTSTPDDTSGADTSTTPAKKSTSRGLAAQDSSGCNVASTGTGGADFGPLAGLLAVVFGFAASRRRKRG